MKRILGWIMIATFAVGVFAFSAVELSVVGALIFWAGVAILTGWLYLAMYLLID